MKNDVVDVTVNFISIFGLAFIASRIMAAIMKLHYPICIDSMKEKRLNISPYLLCVLWINLLRVKLRVHATEHSWLVFFNSINTYQHSKVVSQISVVQRYIGDYYDIKVLITNNCRANSITMWTTKGRFRQTGYADNALHSKL